jgi:hypothetical protein
MGASLLDARVFAIRYCGLRGRRPTRKNRVTGLLRTLTPYLSNVKSDIPLSYVVYSAIASLISIYFVATRE